MNEMTTPPGTGLMLPAGTDLQALFRDGAHIDPLIARIEAEVRSHVPDTSTAKGRDAIKSLAYKVSRSKTALDDAGKALNEEARAQINLVDGARKRIRDRLDALRDEARAPLTAWEEAEAARKERDRQILAQLTQHGLTGHESSAEIINAGSRIKAIALPDDFGVDRDAAEASRSATMAALRSLCEAAKKREEEAAELERLRAEKAERDRADAERLAAERAEQERKEAEARAAREAEERAAREKAQAERIEREKQEAARKAAAEAEERHQRELAKAKRREEEAAQRERDRIAAEKAAEAEAQRKREENARIRNRVRREIAAALAALPQPLTAEAVAEALVAGTIPNCSVRF